VWGVVVLPILLAVAAGILAAPIPTRRVPHPGLVFVGLGVALLFSVTVIPWLSLRPYSIFTTGWYW
jgi:hypothetical protein